jgi:hypothetical protein
MVIVQDIRDLWEENRELPDWLTGVPLLVCARTGGVSWGSSAIRALAEMPPYSTQGPAGGGLAPATAERGDAADDPRHKPSPSPSDFDQSGGSSESTLGGFEPLVLPGENVDEEVASAKITMDEINQALASRGISANGSGPQPPH